LLHIRASIRYRYLQKSKGTGKGKGKGKAAKKYVLREALGAPSAG
jgi:hypothetical protein